MGAIAEFVEMMRRVRRYGDWFFGACLVYGALVLLPADPIWYDPGEIIVADSASDTPPLMEFSRTIPRRTLISYQVTIREVGSNRVVCDPASGPILYKPDSTLPDPLKLTWWTGGDIRGWPRSVGTYVMDTCWTVLKPLWGLLPSKTVCRESNAFTIHKPPI